MEPMGSLEETRRRAITRCWLACWIVLSIWMGAVAVPGGQAEEPADPARAPHGPHVLLVTEKGEIEIELFPERAPVTVANFLRYVDEGLYRPSEGGSGGAIGGATFYRVVRPDNQPGHPVPIEVVQGGLTMEDEHPRRLAPIRHETTEDTGLRHRDGTVSMARNEPGSASSEIFICVGAQPELDFGGRRNPDGQGFAAFGQVVRGMDVVRGIQELPDRGQMLIEPVRILDLRRIETGATRPDRSHRSRRSDGPPAKEAP